METESLWIWYCQERIGDAVERAPDLALAWDQVLECLWEANPVFTPRWTAIQATPYSTQFDEEADGALALLAIDDNFDRWDGLSAGAWRVLAERLVWSETVVFANWSRNTPAAGSRLWAALPRSSWSTVVVLQYLGGAGKAIPPELLARRDREGFPPLPSTMPIRRQ